MMAIACFAKGFRTLSGAFAFLIIGILSCVGSIDLTPVVSLFVKDEKYLGATMVGVGAFFGFLRYLTTTPLFKSEASGESEDRPRRCDPGE